MVVFDPQVLALHILEPNINYFNILGGSRSNSLPRTFNREALLRHPELSMEIDR